MFVCFPLGRLNKPADIIVVLGPHVLDRLSRYEHVLWRQARQIVFTLESLRRRKRQPIRSSFELLSGHGSVG